MLVVDTISQAPQLLNVLLSSILFGTLRLKPELSWVVRHAEAVFAPGIATSLAAANAYILL